MYICACIFILQPKPLSLPAKSGVGGGEGDTGTPTPTSTEPTEPMDTTEHSEETPGNINLCVQHLIRKYCK